MMKATLAAFLSVGLITPAIAAETGDVTERTDIPTAEEATLADCQVWLDQLGELVDVADPPVSEEVMAEAEARHDEVAQACEAGDYHAGIVMAAETIEMIEESADN